MQEPAWHSTVLITGAGSGLGEALTHHYADAGWQVAVTDVDERRAASVLADVVAKGGRGFSLPLDVTNAADWQRAESAVMEHWQGVQVLVNNAGVATAGTVEKTSMDDWQWVLEIDLLGVVRGCRQFSAVMRRQGAGHIVNMASFAGLAGMPGMCSYGVAKAGVVALSEGLRAEMQPHGVGVTVVCPAFVDTALTDTMRATDPDTVGQVQRWMKKSNISAADVAAQVFAAVQAQKFLLLTHAQTRQAWRLKRWWPERYFSVVCKAVAGMKKPAGD